MLTNMTKYKFIFFGLLILLTGCEEQLTPEQTTDAFWSALKTGNETALKKLVSPGSRLLDSEKLNNLEISSWQTGKIIIDGMKSQVETDLELSGKDNIKTTVQTYLLKNNNHWQIDFDTTMVQLQGEDKLDEVLIRLDEISGEMLENLDDSIEKFQEAMPVIEQELSRIEEKLQEKVPEIKQRLDEFARKLEEALKQKKSEVQNKPIEI